MGTDQLHAVGHFARACLEGKERRLVLCYKVLATFLDVPGFALRELVEAVRGQHSAGIGHGVEVGRTLVDELYQFTG